MDERRRLDSWKEIVVYLKKSEKTCRLWERKFGLPVHRIADSPKAHVFAYADEIDRWLQDKIEQQTTVGKDAILPVIGGGDGRGTTASFPEALRLPEAKEYDLKTLLNIARKPRILFPTVAILVVLGSGGYWLLNRNANIRWAKYQAIPEIERLIAKEDSSGAYALARKAQKYIPGDERLTAWMPEVSDRISFITTPPGAEVYIKDYMKVDDPWTQLGQTPIENREIARGYFRWKMEKEGYDTTEGVADTSKEFRLQLEAKKRNRRIMNSEEMAEYLKNTATKIIRVLPQKGSNPEGMILIPGGAIDSELGSETLTDYFMDRYEVTNKQYKDFVDHGGYKNPAFWKQEFVKNGKVLSWDEAMTEFVDSIERPCPSTWKAGNYPEGEDDYPVRGISWYEAAAFAEFAGKSLPSFYHWRYAAGLNGEAAVRTYTHIPWLSNFTNRSPARVGAFQGMSPYGVCDMAGNAREWCWNEFEKGRCVCGGSWIEPSKIFGNFETVDAFDRSESNGFRCAIYQDSTRIATLLAPLREISPPPDYRNEKPCSDEIYQVIQGLYTHEKTELAPRIESTDLSSRDVVLQKVSFSAAYGGERVIAYIYLPKNSKPPYQTVVFFPGQSATIFPSLDMADLKFWDFIPKTGRAFVWPVYKNTLERGGGRPDSDPETWVGLQELLIKWYQDMARSIDYLETRPEFESNKVCYLGFSMGAKWGAVFPALEKRIKCVVLVGGGFRNQENAIPTVRQANFAPRMRLPLLMINGKYDGIFPLETAQIPLFKLFGTPEENKHHVILDTDHSVWVKHDIVVKEILEWLDKYLGPVE